MGETEGKKDEADYKRLQTFPLVRHSDMPEEMRVETMELCVTACEKFSNNNESAAKMIKETMDKKFGSSWHVVIGEGFGFEITHECPSANASMVQFSNAARAASCFLQEKGIQSRLQVQCSAETPGPFSWTIWLTFRKACLWTSLGRKPGSRQMRKPRPREAKPHPRSHSSPTGAGFCP
ncbi:dynein axonemal light chain 4 isoform X3 [Balaenoptera ricei]|uniref:dynein axonemal light chain 4 isoform X3 n=1 Tax=Balaenoptera ricei TaxID=2746895 RepID=UPI0028BD431A|nr:dynein axonemal light chain 4 isoform X3 [Balaenoptera ricei]